MKIERYDDDDDEAVSRKALVSQGNADRRCIKFIEFYLVSLD
jgi:hypothetical protein